MILLKIINIIKITKKTITNYISCKIYLPKSESCSNNGAWL